MLPQVGQGALAVECRSDDDATRAALRAIDDRVVHRAVAAERAFLAELGGGCDLPCGALAHVDNEAVLIEALLAVRDGSIVVRKSEVGSDPEVVGRTVAEAIVRTFAEEAVS